MRNRVLASVLKIAGVLAAVYVALVVLIYFRQRSMLYFPTHDAFTSQLVPWMAQGSNVIGYCREASNPQAIWLMMHGNAGQAAARDYVLRCLAAEDSLYVLEYPGYGSRPGTPSLMAMNRAAAEAYEWLRARNPRTPVCVLGESIGTGPACVLANEKIPPDKIVLVVPFDSLADVASDKFAFLPVKLLLRDRWDNLEALSRYRGPVDIFGARNDGIIPIVHARALAKRIPQARFIEVPCGHNDWCEGDEVKIRF